MEFIETCAKCSNDAESAEALYEIFTGTESKSKDLLTYISQRAIPADLVFSGDFFRLPMINADVLKEIWSTGLRFNCQSCERSIGHQDYEFSSIFEETISSPAIDQKVCQLIADSITETIEETIELINQDEWFVHPLLAQILNSDEFLGFLKNSLIPNESSENLKAALANLSEFEQDFNDSDADPGSGDAGYAVFQNATACLVDGENSSNGESHEVVETEDDQEIDPSDPTLSLDAQKLIAQSSDNYERASLAGNLGAFTEILQVLSTDKDDYVRSSVAANPRITSEVLNRLASDSSPEVLGGVAINPKCGADLLNHLVTQSFLIDSSEHDFDYDGEHIRMQAATNPSLPKELIISLSKDPSALVQSSIAENISTPIELLQTFVENNGDPFDYDAVSIRSGVARNPSCPTSLLQQLANDESEEVRAGVAQNINSTMDILEVLATDTSDRVSYWISNRSEARDLGLDKTSERARFGPVPEKR
jgi:hypothetical protein